MAKTPKAATKEKDVKQQVKKILDDHGWFWWMPPANGFGQTGIADFNGLRQGVFIAIETKFGRNTPTVQQNAFLQSINQEQGFAFVVTEKNIDWLAAFMEAFDKSIIAKTHKQEPTNEDGATMLNAIKELQALIRPQD